MHLPNAGPAATREGRCIMSTTLHGLLSDLSKRLRITGKLSGFRGCEHIIRKIRTEAEAAEITPPVEIVAPSDRNLPPGVILRWPDDGPRPLFFLNVHGDGNGRLTESQFEAVVALLDDWKARLGTPPTPEEKPAGLAPWAPPRGYVGAKAICADNSLPRTTLQGWCESKDPPPAVQSDPVSHEKYYPGDWVNRHLADWQRRKNRNCSS